jgi:chemotaxis regulatin CheY-phosphate phosphatase CheZ
VTYLTHSFSPPTIDFLLTRGRQEQEQQKQEQEQEQQKQKEPSHGEGPQIHADKKEDVVSGQDEVDDLLSSLGF